jgi:hypothetical protein
MQNLPRHINPFAMMINPQAVIAQIEHSARLERLSRRICRPLDKPLLGLAPEDAQEAATFDPFDPLNVGRDADKQAGAASDGLVDAR